MRSRPPFGGAFVSSSDRDEWSQVGPATDDMLRRAALYEPASDDAPKLGRLEFRVLPVIVRMLTGYRRLWDLCSVRQVAGIVYGTDVHDVTHGMASRVGRALGRLGAAGVIAYEPAPGPGTRSLIALTPDWRALTTRRIPVRFSPPGGEDSPESSRPLSKQFSPPSETVLTPRPASIHRDSQRVSPTPSTHAASAGVFDAEVCPACGEEPTPDGYCPGCDAA